MAGDRLIRVVANPVAGSGRARRSMPRLWEALEAEGVDHAVRWTGTAGSAAELAREAVDEGATHVVAAGGDGTVGGAAGALAGTDAALVVAPWGSGNDFAAAVAAPRSPEAVAAAAARGPTRAVDVGRLDEERRFANGLGIGLDGAAAARVEASPRLTGKIGYALAAAREALTFSSFPMAVEAPEGRLEGSVLLAGVSNGPSHGGGFQVAPGAEVDDGALDAYRVGALGVATRLRYLPKVRRGTHVDLEAFRGWRTGKVTFELGEAVPAHLDGEVLTLEAGRHVVEVEAGALTVADAPA